METSGKQTSVPNGRLKITLPNLTYPKAWTGSVPLCPLIFSWFDIFFKYCDFNVWKITKQRAAQKRTTNRSPVLYE